MIRTPSYVKENKKFGHTNLEINNINNINKIKMLTREIEPEELSLIRQKHNEKKELLEAADLVRDFVNVLKEGMQKNYDDNKSNHLTKIIDSQSIKNLTLDGSFIFNKFNSKKSYERKSFDSMKNPLSFNFQNNFYTNNINPNNNNRIISKKNSKSKHPDDKNKDITIEINPPSDDIIDSQIALNNSSSHNIIKNCKEDFYKIKKSIELPKENLKKNYNRLSLDKKNNIVFGQNFKNSFLSESDASEIENRSLMHSSSISYDYENILKLNDIKKQIKSTFIGEQNNDSKIKNNEKYLDDELNNSNQTTDINFIEQRYRVLQRKGYVYDSLDDEENLDEEKRRFFIKPESRFIILFDFFLTLSSLYYLTYIPYFLGSREFFCQNSSYFIRENILELFVDFVFIFDFILPFFTAFYNFDEILQTRFRQRSKKYLKGWFILDLLQAIPLKTIFTLFDRKCKNKEYLTNPLYNDEFHYLLLCIRQLKIFKVFYKNKFLTFLSNYLNEFEYFSDYLTVYISILTFLIAIHIVSNIFIFIGRNDYPNWIITFGYSGCSYYELYLIGIYYTITTLTTVGYGDLHCTSKSEKVFGMFMEVVGIFAYSFALTSVSNYVKVLHERTEQYEKNCKILEEIKITNPKLPEDLYERIARYLKYKQDKEQFDKNIIIDCLPVNLSNLLVFEMYKPIIENFVFFKNFDNVDFIVKVILNFKPILAVKNDMIIKEGDFVEDIIFVKKGKLSLELPLDSNPKNNNLQTILKQSEINPLLPSTIIGNQNIKNNGNLFLKQQGNIQNDGQFFVRRHSSIFQNIQTFSEVKKKKRKIRRFFNKFRRKKKKIVKKSNVQNYKILEIRKNEHFGDILMFLNQRSPLNLRVKTKKAELFFLNKTDAIDISTSYPSIWEKINVKSLFNYEQIKRLMNKIIKIFNNSHGLINYNPLSKFTVDNNYGNTTLAPYEIYDEEDELKSIPTLSNYDSEKEYIRNTQSIKKKKSPNKSTAIKVIQENSCESDCTSFEKISEKSFEEDSHVENQSIIDSQNDDTPKSNMSKFTNRHKTKSNFEKHNVTPFQPEEINDEIYPDETFINSPNKFIKDKEMFNEQCLKNKLYNNNNIDNVSICSTEISFSIKSEYENIDEISDYKYSKDISLRNKVKKILKNEDEIESNLTKEFSDSNFLNTSENYKSDYNGSPTLNPNNIKKGITYKNTNSTNKKGQRKSISFLKLPVSTKPISNLRKTGTSTQSENNSQYQNKYTKSSKKRKAIQHSTTKNKTNLLKALNKNIERNQINLNNPDLFYSEYFVKILGKTKEQQGDNPLNKETEELINKLEKKNTISRMNTLNNNLTNNLSSAFKEQI